MFLKFQQLSCFAPKVIQHSLHTAIIHNVNVDSGSSFQSVNPATGRTVGIVSDCTKNETLSAIESVHDCFKEFRSTLPSFRAKLLINWGDLITKNRKTIAELVTMEMGNCWQKASVRLILQLSSWSILQHI